MSKQLDQKTINYLTDELQAKIIGSFVFYEMNLLGLEDIKSIDVAINEKYSVRALEYIINQGYVYQKQNTYYHPDHPSIRINYHADGYPIYNDLKSIIEYKMERMNNSDRKQIQKALINAINQKVCLEEKIKKNK